MKKVSLFLVSCLTALSVFAQYDESTVTIKINGTRTQQVLVDGDVYQAAAYSGTAPIMITDLTTGQHTLEVVRRNQANNYKTTFTTRPGYDMTIIINNNGTVSMRETVNKYWNSNYSYHTPMPDATFTTLLQSVQKEWRASARMTLVNNAFSNTANYFTSSQAKQLVQLVNSQNNRLKLAKLVYPHITDPLNYRQMYELLNYSRQNELAAYIKTYNENNPEFSQSPAPTPMSTTSFNTLYQNVSNQFSSSARVTAVANAFTNTNNYFTTYQARQLLLLINDERNRLELAKLSYRGITDPTNFTQIYDVLNSQASRNELSTYVSNYKTGTVYTPNYRMAMSDADFAVLYEDVQDEFGLGQKNNALTRIFATPAYYFTTAQAKQLILLISDENNRLTQAKASYAHITDPANFGLMYDVLSTQTSRNDLAAYVNTYNYNNGIPANTGVVTYRTPMADADFNSLYNSVSNTWGLGAKMSSLQNIFANTSYYFTTAQAKQLIKLVSSETNRLTLAKSSYSHITDPANFSSMYDIFASQASKDQLAVYVRDYDASH